MTSIQINQDNLPILNLSTSIKSLLSCKIIYLVSKNEDMDIFEGVLFSLPRCPIQSRRLINSPLVYLTTIPLSVLIF